MKRLLIKGSKLLKAEGLKLKARSSRRLAWEVSLKLKAEGSKQQKACLGSN